MITRRAWFSRAAMFAGGAVLADRFGSGAARAQMTGHDHGSMPGMKPPPPQPKPSGPAGAAVAKPRGNRTPRSGYTPVVTPDLSSLPWRMNAGVKEFHLIAEEVEREFAPGMVVKCWGYNGMSPGPTIEAVEGDRLRIFVSNRLPEHTSVHWHGIFTPNGMDGVSGLLQPPIQPGETYVYEFTLKQHGTFMYHPHADEMIQIAVGMMGFFIVHPKAPREEPIDRDFCLFPHMWAIDPGTMRPNPNVMLDFNIFTLNGRAFPGTSPLVVKQGDRVRLRFANVGMTSHPMHIHGHRFWVVETDGGQIPKTAWWPETSLNIASGTTRAVEFIANEPGDWPLHCHKSHHTMNAMGHDVPNVLGSDQSEVGNKVSALVSGYMAMGSTGMAEHAQHAAHMSSLPNTLPMMTGTGPYGSIEMGGMFTVIKVREHLASYDDPGWYDHPAGTVAWKLDDLSKLPPAG
ncbi:MAG: copper oxidase [Acidobacteriota bacterium]